MDNKVAGIICEYNPMHLGHVRHIEMTKRKLGKDCAIVCVMSGNYVQRGDVAVFSKHSRAEAALRCGADLVLEMPTPYVLSSAEGFAGAGVHILESLGICGSISFGSESGDIESMSEAAKTIATPEAQGLIRQSLREGVSYAAAMQKAADIFLKERSAIFKSPNNLLGIEYLKALEASGSKISPITIKRVGGKHDGNTGFSASALRKMLREKKEPWEYMPYESAGLCMREIEKGRGPVSMEMLDLAMLSRLRALEDFSAIPGAVEGLDRRFLRYAKTQPSISALLEKVKTKRYTMSRLRRMLMCACLGITSKHVSEPPPYIRVLAMNDLGMMLLKSAKKKTNLPIIIKPATGKKLSGMAGALFAKEASATDFFTLGFPDEIMRYGHQEWTISPVVIRK